VLDHVNQAELLFWLDKRNLKMHQTVLAS